MYVVTFYSFKGGVGRSMSLVNVGVQLAQAGRKVLLVDFDLEAPGLPTFSLKKPKEESFGVVEYVSEYITTGESPDVAKFIYESENFPKGGKIWVMPVGKQDAGYSNRLNSIDWRKLYTEQSGYVFFEDLKRQWEESLAPDYVLIDSRTGHSDVEGICTRQLPNAVTLLFFPNEQNLHGLKRIVANINSDNLKSQNNPIKVHFAVSNVPDLDDEDQILIKTMQRFKRELGYKELAAEIHHYNSLSLLNQEIFSLTHPNSRLTKEYKTLTKTIAKYNLEDRDAVVAFLKSAHRNLKESMYEDGPKEFHDKLQKILKNFSQDGEVIFRAALVFEQLGNNNEALSMLTSKVVEQQYAIAPMYATRARLLRSLGENENAANNLSEMLDADSAEIGTFLEVAPLMEQLAPKLFDRIPESIAFNSLSKRDQEFLAFQFEGNEQQLKAKINILRKLQQENTTEGNPPKEYLTHEMVLALIRIGNSSAAIELLSPANNDLASLDIVNIFNLAMAAWGRDGKPNKDLFEFVIKRHMQRAPDKSMEANYLQCMAISYAVCGDREKALSFLSDSKKEIRNITSREFSAWTYSRVPPKVFLEHLHEIEKLVSGEEIVPGFIAHSTLRS